MRRRRRTAHRSNGDWEHAKENQRRSQPSGGICTSFARVAALRQGAAAGCRPSNRDEALFGTELAKRTQRASRELRAFARRSCGPPTSVRSKRMMRCSGRSLRRGATCGPSRGEAAARRRLRRRTVRHTHSCDLRANLHLSDRRLRSVRMAVRAAARRSPTESNPAARDDARKPAEVSSAPPRQPAALCGIEPEPRPLVGDGASTVSIKKSAVPGSFYSLN